MNKKFVRAPQDETEFLLRTAHIEGECFLELKEKKDYATVERFFHGAKTLFQNLDQEMIRICPPEELVIWAVRLGIIVRKFDDIERNLPHVNTRLFDWESVTGAMGYINAFRVAAEQTIALNEVPEGSEVTEVVAG